MPRLNTLLHVALIVCLVLILLTPSGDAVAQQNPQPTDDTVAETIAETVMDAAVDDGATDAKTGLPTEVLDPAIDTTELEYRLVPLTKDELSALAAEWVAIVKDKTSEVMAAQIAIYKTEGNVEEAARDKLTELVQARKSQFDKFDDIVSALEKKGGDEAEVAEYRAYRNSIIVEETRKADVRTLMAVAAAWLTDADGGIQLAKNVGIALLLLAALLFVSAIVRRLARGWFGRVPNLSKLLQTFLVTFVYWIIMAFGLMVVLSALGVDITPAFALVGGASFILAFAFQDTLGNLASGLMIMINRPFDEGDYVDVGGVAGTVKAVSIVATKVVTPDNQIIVIPNKNVWNNVITNVTGSDTRRVDLVFGISYEDSVPDAIRVMEDTVKAHPLVLEEPAPTVRLHELADSSVNFICRPWTKTTDYWTVYWDLTRQMKQRFDESGISIPYPQQDVHFRSSAPAGKRETFSEVPEFDMAKGSAGRVRSAPGSVDAKPEASAIAAGEDGYDDRTSSD
jgi:small conductance mechanosensitive channel